MLKLIRSALSGFVITIFTIVFFSCSETGEIGSKDGFIKLFGNSYEDEIGDLKQTSDKGFIILGTTTSASGRKNIILIKTDEKGDENWKKEYGEENTNEYGKSILIDSDGGYIILGYTEPEFESQRTEIELFKVTQNGEQTWTIDETDKKSAWESRTCEDCDVKGTKMNFTNDGNLIITGSLNAKNDGNGNPEGIDNILLAKADLQGNVIWAYSYGGAYNDIGYDVKPTNENGYILIGTTESFNEFQQSKLNAIAIKTNENGIQTDKLTYGGDNDDTGLSIETLYDGTYIFTGTSISENGNGRKDVYLVKLGERLHEIEWQKYIGGPADDEGAGLIINENGDYVIVGTTMSYGSGNKDMFFVIAGPDGETKSSVKTYGGIGTEIGQSIISTAGGGYLIGGSTLFEKNSMITIVKTDENGNQIDK